MQTSALNRAELRTLLLRLQGAVVVAAILGGAFAVTARNASSAADAKSGTAGSTAARSLAAPDASAPAVTTKTGSPAVPRPVAQRAPAPTSKPQPVAKAPRAAAGARWMPVGTGMWTHQWNRTEGGNATRVVARAKRMGLSHLYVRTGTLKGGFDGGPMLDQLLPRAEAAGIKIIAWDFPMLDDPKGEARRLARAATHRAAGGLRVAAVAPDIETTSEGTQLTRGRVDTYYRELRRLLPPEIAILATVPWPSEHRLNKYPYDLTAKWADALVPMAYWINRDPVIVTRQSMQRLRGYGKPVMPVGQAYDPRIDVPGLHLGAPSTAQVKAFIANARAFGAPSVSLWVWQTATNEHWRALSHLKWMFDQPLAQSRAVLAAAPASRSRSAAATSSSKGSAKKAGSQSSTSGKKSKTDSRARVD